MKNIGIACVLGILGVMANSLVAQALDFNFSFTGTGYTKGNVTGLIQGLKDNAQSSPTRIIIYKNSVDVPEGTVLINESVIKIKGDGLITVKNGQITNVKNVLYYSKSLKDGLGGPKYSVWLGYVDFNTLTNNIWLSVSNSDGFKGVKYTPAGTTSPITTSKPEQYEVRLRLFIPSPAAKVIAYDTVCSLNNAFCVFGGDNRRFSYNALSHRYIANAIVTTDLKSKSPIVGIPFRDSCPTNRYLPSSSYQSLGKPDWWLNLKPGSKPIETKKFLLNTETSKVNTVSAALVTGENNTVKVSFKVSASNPLVSVAPGYDADINVFIQDKPGEKPLVRVEGEHDGFPAYEIYVNGQEVYGYDPEKKGADLSNLYPPLDVTISKPWTQWSIIKNNYSVQKLPSCENSSIFGGGSSGGGGASGNY